MADKDKNDNVEHKKMQEEQNLIEKAYNMLIKQYGYSKSQIEKNWKVPWNDEFIADLVVFHKGRSRTGKNAGKDTPLIVIEIKRDGFLLPLHRHQLENLMRSCLAGFGVLYDGNKKLCYTRLNLEDLNIVEVVDIPVEKSFRRHVRKATDEEHTAIIITLNRLVENFRVEKFAPFEKYFPHILAMMIIDIRQSTGYFHSLLDSTAGNYDTDPVDMTTNQQYRIVLDMINQTKDLFPFLQWEELEQEIDKIEAMRRRDTTENDYLESLNEEQKTAAFAHVGLRDTTNQEEPYETGIITRWSDSWSHSFYEILFALADIHVSSVTLEKAIHDVLVEYVQSSPASRKGAEGSFFTPDVLVNFSLHLLYPRLGEKLLIADSPISLLTVKHFLIEQKMTSASISNNYVKKNITAMSTHEPNGIIDFEMMLPEFNLKVGDSMRLKEGLGMFDCVFSCPAFGMQQWNSDWKKEFGDFGNKSENYLILNMLKHVNPGGKLALVLPSSFLFHLTDKEKADQDWLDKAKGGITKKAKDAREIESGSKMRNEIAKKCYIRAIIELPPGTFNRYTGISACFLLLEKKDKAKKSDKPDSWYSSNYKIFMAQIKGKSKPQYHELTTLDSRSLSKARYNFVRFESTQPEYADESSLKFADWEQDSLGFAVNYNDLGDKWTVEDKTPASRAYEKMQNPQKLGDVVKSISSSKIKPEEISSAETTLNAYKESSSLEEINILRISDLENGFVKSEIPKKVRLSKKAINKNTKKEFLEDNDIIVSNQGTIGKTAIYRKDKRKILPSPQIFIIKADTNQIHPEYLFTQLNQKLIQDKLKSSATGVYIPRLTKKDLENIVISVPSKEEQEKSLGRYMELKEARDQLKKEIMKIEKKLREIDLNG